MTEDLRQAFRNWWCKLWHRAGWRPAGMHRREYYCASCSRDWQEADIP